LHEAAAKARSPETKAVIEALGTVFTGTGQPDFGDFVRQQRAALFPPGSENAAERTDAALNGMPLAFALGSPAALMSAAAADFASARRMNIGTVTNFLFSSTAYYFGREEALPQFANLVTFREFNAGEVMALPARYSYLRWWNAITQDAWLLVWLLALAAMLIVARRRGAVAVAPASYATALVLSGLLIMLVNSFFTELLPRYTAPMFELTFLSLVLLIGQTLELARSDDKALVSPS
jgi:hypothetical protein